MSSVYQDDEFRVFVSTHGAALLRFAFMLTGDHGHAEDLVKTALKKAAGRWTRIHEPAARRAYVRRVMVNTQTSWLRRRRVTEHFVDVIPESGIQPEDCEHIEGRILPALALLPNGMRAVLLLRFYEELSEAETARLLGCAVGTVKSQTSRGLARLRTYFAGDGTSAAALRGGLR